MIIGLDFDNTIITYDDVFRAEARARGLIDIDDGLTGKREIRDAIRRLQDGERKWQELQGFVYGRGIVEARMCDGVGDFLRRCRDRGHRVVIVSHKTRYGHFDPTQTDLRAAALDWMTARRFFARDGLGLSRGDVFFHDSRADKLACIAKLGCTHFIDDLEEVLSDPAFPPHVGRMLFSGERDAGRPRSYPSYPTWSAISAALFPSPPMRSAGGLDDCGADTSPAPPREVAARLVGGPVDEIEPVGGGRNSRVYKLTSQGRSYALKHYLRTPSDMRDRLATEVDALGLMQRGGVAAIPRVVAVDRSNDCIAMAWIDGTPVSVVADADIDHALAFLADVRRLAPTATFPPSRLASEACLCGAEIEDQLGKRLARLCAIADAEPELRAFLECGYVATQTRLCAQARARASDAGIDFERPLPTELRTLIPADFGFHNGLRVPDGSMVFFDFEYFGWDDPVKLTADVLLHPGSRMSDDQRWHFRRGAERLYHGDSSFGARLAALYPLFALRWTLILLNEFLPDRWHRRQFAADAGDWREAKARQIDRAKLMLQEAERA